MLYYNVTHNATGNKQLLTQFTNVTLNGLGTDLVYYIQVTAINTLGPSVPTTACESCAQYKSVLIIVTSFNCSVEC